MNVVNEKIVWEATTKLSKVYSTAILKDFSTLNHDEKLEEIK